MKRRYKVLGALLALLASAVLALALALSYESPCGSPGAIQAGQGLMKAIVYRCYGSAEVLKLEDIPKPVPADDELLVKVHAASVNPLDWHYMRGEPYIMRMSAGFGRPKETRFGVDFAGTVEAVGAKVQKFKPGDEVFGGRTGAFGQYVVIRESRSLVLKPANISFGEAAAVPIAAITALQALRDKGGVKPGTRVLINGASGGVGTFAVQIAKSLGAEVTGVCSTRNVELVRALGADHVIDYTKEDFTQGDRRYDVIIDNVGNHPLRAHRRVLEPNGIFVIVGGSSKDPWLGPMVRPIGAAVMSPFVSQQFSMLMAELNPQDLGVLRDLLAAGKLRSVIDRRYALAETPAAVAYVEEGHARGKVVIDVE
jgi:NADPH:quinone reductase-like Zn-dependent oxidoreductase